jgi:hypothetical protein
MRSEVSSPFSNLEVIEKHEENQTGARERNLTSSVNSTAIIVLARWDLLSYPQAYPAFAGTGAASTDTAFVR